MTEEKEREMDTVLTGSTKFECTECEWRETVPALGVRAAELADEHHPEHVVVRVHQPSPRLVRKRRQWGRRAAAAVLAWFFISAGTQFGPFKTQAECERIRAWSQAMTKSPCWEG